MWSGLWSWIVAFEFAVWVVKKTPQTKRRAPTSATFRSGAIASSQTPKPAAPTNITRQLARASAAEASEPRSAPAPKHADGARPGVERLLREDREQDVEVEADRGKDHHHP